MARPNIVFFFTDDQRHDTIRALGNREIYTPNMDALAAAGTAFTNACIMGGSNGAVCMPSRAMLHSGRTLFHLHNQGEMIPAEHATLGQTFRQAEYQTYHIGKWHQDRESFNRSFEGGARIFGFTRGWYDHFGGHWNVAVHDYDPTAAYPPETGYILAADKTTHLPIEPGVGGVHSSEMFADAAVEFLRNRRDGSDRRPFFLNLSFVAPHDPRTAPDSFEELYPPDRVSLPENFMPRHPFDNGEMVIRDEMLEGWPRRRMAIRKHLGDYYAMITHADSQIGRVIRTLKELGEYENTIFVFAGDNGLAVGQHGLLGKQSLYQHSVGVPLIFAGPGIPAGKTSDAFAYLLDVFPTLCDLASVKTPASVEGKSLVPVLAGRENSPRETMLFAYRHVQRGARDHRYKLIEYVVNGKRTTQLFDLWTDPLEINNLAGKGEHAEHQARLGKELQRWRTELDDTRPDFGQVFWSGYDAAAK